MGNLIEELGHYLQSLIYKQMLRSYLLIHQIIIIKLKVTMKILACLLFLWVFAANRDENKYDYQGPSPRYIKISIGKKGRMVLCQDQDLSLVTILFI